MLKYQVKHKTGQILRSLDEQQKYKRIFLCNVKSFAVLILERTFQLIRLVFEYV